ncbi:HTH domain-containing protein [Acetivibrio thermocellus AD2]|jgi:biotin operon repressor|uniref:HTH domain-containing protein n=1 Tax=Acetivibrio thermocellus AD2 TaxID=1138384 RepID=A0AB36TEP6_ACETH|nr:AAA family ATPase [Acetivibrio thermocellus]ADU73571.1 regulatory protein DeoR [Acetivibrio thermocellus DSM 1313]ALX07492.1 regulatory protein DeoR [Acetivibrio thermocellus AD2]ANV75231.1 regulatory protein DeoR [Acetivibrio thermocellus DSM 2360]EIC03412.1 regulatory protein DeoR [Acetivibrio thermocellus YS]PFH01756.1 HTH domain-containing protein [Acetivibrio thermocellus AD2]
MKKWRVDFNESLHPEPWRDFYARYFPELDRMDIKEDGFTVQSLKCLYHDDRKPSATVNVKSGFYVCHVCGSFSPYRFLVEIAGIAPEDASYFINDYLRELYVKDERTGSYLRAFPHYDPSHTYIPTPGQEEEFEEFIKEAKARLRPELPIVQEYITARGIKYEMLERFEWGYVPHDEEAGQVECLVVPFRVRGKIRAIRGRAYDGRKGAVKNSRFSLWNLDSLEGKSQAVIVEGESDALRTIQALEACGVDIPVVSVPGNNFRKEWKREFEGIRTIYLIPQDDDASANFVRSALAVLGEERCKVVELPWKRGDVGKDICEWLTRNNHTDQELVELIPLEEHQDRFSRYYRVEELLKREPAEPDWLVKGMIARGQKILVQGPPKQMKTWFVLSLLKALSRGENVCGVPFWRTTVSGIKAVMVEEEHSTNALIQRVQQSLAGTSNIVIPHRTGVKLLPKNPEFEDLLNFIDEFRPDLLVLDPLRSFFDGDENDSSVMQQVFAPLNMLLRKYPHMAVVVVDHTAKKPSDVLVYASRGSSVKGAEMDGVIDIRKFQKDEDVGVVVTGEFRDAETVENLSLKFEDGNLVYDDGFRINIKLKDSEVRLQKLAKLLTQRSYTQKELTDLLKVSDQTVRNDISKLRAGGFTIEEEGGHQGSPKTYTLTKTPDGWKADDEDSGE